MRAKLLTDLSGETYFATGDIITGSEAVRMVAAGLAEVVPEAILETAITKPVLERAVKKTK